MTTLRLIADDLTGALDTAAEFVGLTGPVPVYWSGAIPADLPPSAAVDSGTRELGRERATATTAQLAKGLVGASIAYKKVDSLLRGHTRRELGLLTQQLPPPGTLIVAGGETLRALCVALGATALEAHGQIEPGLPHSKMRSGRWDSVEVVSKSGAFGGPSLWLDLLNLDFITSERAEA